jgi:sulfite reductase (NADPH) flavoprotein alpha-component
MNKIEEYKKEKDGLDILDDIPRYAADEITVGTCFLPFHWGRDDGFFKAANNLTISARDPVSRQPELKACAMRVRKVLEFPVDDN